MNRTTMVLVLCLALAGCYVGARAETLELARSPRGANIQLQLRAGSVAGELLEVQDTALVVLSLEQRLMLVPYRAVQRGEVELMREVTYGGRQPSAARRQQLRRISRYPQGLTPETQRALLAAYSQADFEVVRQ
jgi:hypothetical protein